MDLSVGIYTGASTFTVQWLSWRLLLATIMQISKMDKWWVAATSSLYFLKLNLF